MDDGEIRGGFPGEGSSRPASTGKTGSEEGSLPARAQTEKACGKGQPGALSTRQGNRLRGVMLEAGRGEGDPDCPASRALSVQGPYSLAAQSVLWGGHLPGWCGHEAGWVVPRRFRRQTRREGCLLASATTGPHNRSCPSHRRSPPRISRLWPYLISLIKPKVAARHFE